MLSKNHPIVLFIDRSGFSVYQDTLTNIPKFNFTPDLVVNLDVINKEQFSKLIETFIQVNKVIGSSLVVILSDSAVYVKDLVNPVQKPSLVQDLKANPASGNKEREDEVQKFLEKIPFEEVLAKVIKIGNANRIVAVNKDLVTTITDVFAGKGSTVESIIPGFMYGQNVNFTAGLTLQNVQVVLGNTETLKLGNLLTDQERVIPFQNLESELKNPLTDIKPDLVNGTRKPQKLKQYLLIGVFVILLVILAVVYFSSNASQAPPKSSQANEAPTVIPTLIQTSITPSPIDLKTINIKITHSAQSSETAASLKSSLTGLGFQNVLDEVTEMSAPEKSSVTFSQNIPEGLRNNTVAEIKKVLPDISILENQESDSTINIVIGKS